MWIILLAWNHNKAWNTRLKKGKEQSAFGAEGINEQYSQSQFSSFYWLIHPGHFKRALCSANHFPQLSSSLRELFGSAFAGQASYGKPATRSNDCHCLDSRTVSCVTATVGYHCLVVSAGDQTWPNMTTWQRDQTWQRDNVTMWPNVVG